MEERTIKHGTGLIFRTALAHIAHHANNRKGLVVVEKSFSHGGIARKVVALEALANHKHFRRASAILVRETAAFFQRDPHGAEVVSVDYARVEYAIRSSQRGA